MTQERANTDKVHALIRADMLGGLYEPGQKLKFARLSRHYCASISVIRESLTRLAEQRLVAYEPMVGFRAMMLSADDLCDLTSVRIDLESLALRDAIASGDMDWESNLVGAHHRLEQTPLLTSDGPSRVSDDWETAHARFHAALLSGCQRPRLLEMCQSLRDESELYRRWSQPLEPERDVAAEHRAIFEATLAHDKAAAAQALSDHYNRTKDILVRSLRMATDMDRTATASESPVG